MGKSETAHPGSEARYIGHLQSPGFGHFRIDPHCIFIHEVGQIRIVGRPAEGMHGGSSVIKPVKTFRWFFVWCVFRQGIKSELFKS